jgi:hypothetical protein
MSVRVVLEARLRMSCGRRDFRGEFERIDVRVGSKFGQWARILRKRLLLIAR